jgi:hypothetical protein
MTINKRIDAFAQLGEFLAQCTEKDGNKSESQLNRNFYDSFNELIQTVHFHNAWFTEDNVRNAIAEISAALNKEALEKWVAVYDKNSFDIKKPKRVAVIMEMYQWLAFTICCVC